MTKNLAQLCKEHLAARARGKEAYTEADELLDEILKRAKPGQVIAGKFRVKDNFAGGNKVYRAHGIARLEVEET